jgi:hypothetical protein
MKESKICVLGMMTLIAALGLFMSGCTKPDTPADEIIEDTLSGIWDGNIAGITATVVVADYEGVPSPYALGGWLISIPENDYMDAGTYAMIDDVATLYSNVSRGGIIGTATVGENNTIAITLNKNSIAPGTHILTRR